MKHLLAISAAAAVLAAVSPFAIAQSDGMKGMDMKGMDMKDDKGMDMKMEKKAKGEKKASGKTHKGTGKVTKVDPATNSVTIAHEPVSTMNWPAMTMTFKAKDKALLEKMKQGEKVDFEFVQQGKDYIVTAVK
jgi:Cu(I)/Ag(I) efflux system periplasmic protein CusF